MSESVARRLVVDCISFPYPVSLLLAYETCCYTTSRSCRNQSTVSGHRLVRSVGEPKGGPSLVHSDRMWSAVCSGAPHRQAAEGRRPQRYMLAPKRPTPVWRWFKVTHSLRGRSAPGGMFVPGGMVSCTGFIVSCQSCFHCSIRLKLEFARYAAWRLKGRRERRHWQPRFWAVAMRACKRWEVSSRAFLTSMDVWCSLRSVGGAIPERTWRYFTEVGRR